MIYLDKISHLLDNEFYFQLVADLQNLNSYLPKINWVIDNEYTNLLRIDSTNLSKDIRFYWDDDANIICTVNDFEVAANCTMEETISELKEYLIEHLIIS